MKRLLMLGLALFSVQSFAIRRSSGAIKPNFPASIHARYLRCHDYLTSQEAHFDSLDVYHIPNGKLAVVIADIPFDESSNSHAIAYHSLNRENAREMSANAIDISDLDMEYKIMSGPDSVPEDWKLVGQASLVFYSQSDRLKYKNLPQFLTQNIKIGSILSLDDSDDYLTVSEIDNHPKVGGVQFVFKLKSFRLPSRRAQLEDEPLVLIAYKHALVLSGSEDLNSARKDIHSITVAHDGLNSRTYEARGHIRLTSLKVYPGFKISELSRGSLIPAGDDSDDE